LKLNSLRSLRKHSVDDNRISAIERHLGLPENPPVNFITAFGRIGFGRQPVGEGDAMHDLAFDVGSKVKRAGGRTDRSGEFPRHRAFSYARKAADRDKLRPPCRKHTCGESRIAFDFRH